MKLIFLRHGDRNAGFGDVPLSTRGHQQAEELSQTPELHKVDHIYCSPKRRARETVEPLAQTLGQNIDIVTDLDQMKQIENPNDFSRRIHHFLSALPVTEGKTILVCSHSDWLQAATLLLGGEEFIPHAFFSCAEYKIFENKEGTWKVLTP